MGCDHQQAIDFEESLEQGLHAPPSSMVALALRNFFRNFASLIRALYLLTCRLAGSMVWGNWGDFLKCKKCFVQFL
jgi:hypothetical protein